MQTNSRYTIQDLLYGIGITTAANASGGLYQKLSNRQDVLTMGAQWIADSVIEFSRDYVFQDLEDSGPVVEMAVGQIAYDLSTFVNPTDIITYTTQVPSFYMYYSVPLNGVTGYNPGVGLAYKDISALELMFNTPGTPAYWTRFKNQIYFAPQPNNTFYTYMRYQKQHPFSKPAALIDVIMLPDDWREVIEYSAALRGAGNLRMLDYASSYKTTLHGDPKKPSDVGMLAARVSQMESDIVSNQAMRQIRPMGKRV